MKYIIICLIILLAVVPVVARTVELSLHPAKSLKPEQKYRLLVEADEQSDADAAPLYEKAIQSLPSGLKMDEIEQWLKTPPDELSLKKVQSTLQLLEPALELLEQAAKCKRCEWPYLYDDELLENLREHRRLLFIHALKVRFLIAHSRYDDAIGTMQTGFAMARHLGDDSTLVRGMVGVGIAAYICGQLEQFVQRPDAPVLYEALRDLPQPVIDLSEQAEFEDPDIREKVHLLMNRLDRHVTILQCIEAMRLYAAAHDGQLPETLSDISTMEIPKDVMSGNAFEYRRTSTGAVLKSVMPEGGGPKDMVHYVIVLKK